VEDVEYIGAGQMVQQMIAEMDPREQARFGTQRAVQESNQRVLVRIAAQIEFASEKLPGNAVD
jgi:hypothetical protein